MTSEAEGTRVRRAELHKAMRALTFEPLMRGTVVERRRKCGKAACACAKDPAARHGGKWLTVSLGGKAQALHVRPADEERIQKAIAAYNRLWQIINELTACELADLRRKARERRRDRRRAQDP